jgi:hypothetical protein
MIKFIKKIKKTQYNLQIKRILNKKKKLKEIVNEKRK